MKIYITEIDAICPITGSLDTFEGPRVPGISFDTAEQYCMQNAIGYCKVVGELIADFPCKPDGTPDMKKGAYVNTPFSLN